MPLETPLFIESRHGEMFAIEHLPDGAPPDYWVISMNSGLQCRSGPRRLYVHFARRLAEEGLGVLRIDLSGVGDSDGPVPATHFDMHNPDDADVAIKFIRNKYDPKGIILHGLCAGSRVSIKTAARDTDIAGLLAWSTTIYTATPGSTHSPEEPKHGVSNAVARYNEGRILNVLRDLKFLRWSFWKKHFTSGKLLAELRSSFWSAWLLLFGGSESDQKGWFIRSIRSYVASNRPVFFVYGEKDQYCHMEFIDLQLPVSPDDVLVIPEGNHTFSTRSQRDQVIDGCCNWLRRHNFC